jgi:hypothetical protein
MRALTEIATIRIASEGAPGFARVCVRSGLEDLLDDAAVTVSEIESWLGGIEQHFDGVGFVERPGVIPGSFAFLASDGTSVYGVQQNGLVQIAGFRSSIPESFMSLANDSSLLIVDWIHASIVGA